MATLRNEMVAQERPLSPHHVGHKLKDDEAQQLLLAIAEAERAGFKGTREALVECLSMVMKQ